MSTFRNIFMALCTLLLMGCAIQLVPDYDEALVESLEEVNTKTLTLFAALENGSPQSKYADYEDRYADIIGQFDSIQQRAKTRQLPPLAKRIAKMSIAQKACKPDPMECINSSPASVQSALATLRSMRNKHRDSPNGLEGGEAGNVHLFYNAYTIAIGQALAVETALKR